MRLVARTPEEKFKVVKALTGENQKAYLLNTGRCDEPTIRICTLQMFQHPTGKEIKQAAQLTERDYKLIL